MVYDCFIFFNELDLLEIRLNTLNEVVDKFVLVEATRTHQGKYKPLFFSQNKDRFQAFQDKIIHIIVDNYPPFASWKDSNSWYLERHQRNAIACGLKNCIGKDVVIISDLDEIPDPTQIFLFKDQPGLKVFQQRNFYYYLNCVGLNPSEKWWYGSVMSHYDDFKKPQDLRSVSKKMHGDQLWILKNKLSRFFKSIWKPIYRKEITIIEKGGWHFGYLGGADKIIEKLEAFAHTEFNKDELKNKAFITEAINNGEDILGRGFKYSFVELDSSFPPYVQKNMDRFRHLIKC